jgi:hypothetical protein
LLKIKKDTVIETTITNISTWSIIIPAIIGFLTLDKLQTNSRLIFLLVVTGAFTQIIANYSSEAAVRLLYNINIPVEYTIILLFFKTSFLSKRRKKIFYSLAIAGIVLAIFFVVFIGIKDRFISEWVCFNNIIFTAWILLLLLEIYEDDSIYLNQKTPLFWYLLGLFFYTSCTVLIFCFWGYITTTTNHYFTILFQIYGLFNIFMYIAFSIGLVVDVMNNISNNKK